MNIIQDGTFTFISRPFGDFQTIKNGVIDVIGQIGLTVAIAGPLGTEDQAARIQFADGYIRGCRPTINIDTQQIAVEFDIQLTISPFMIAQGGPVFR